MERYVETDEIELRLKKDVGYSYWLEWRFKRPRKFLFFKIRDKWRRISYYIPVTTCKENPDCLINWGWRSFYLGMDSEVQKYRRIKETVKTKKELFDYFHVKENIDLYHTHLERYEKWLEDREYIIKDILKNN